MHRDSIIVVGADAGALARLVERMNARPGASRSISRAAHAEAATTGFTDSKSYFGFREAPGAAPIHSALFGSPREMPTEHVSEAPH
jgi:hypothetical protein